MNKNDVLQFVVDYVKQENDKEKVIEYQLLTGCDQLSIADYFDCYDSRLADDLYIRDSITIIGKSRKNNTVLASSTIFATEYDTYKNVFFWRKTADKRVLEKVFLETYKPTIGDVCVTLGFTQIAAVLGKDIVPRIRMVNMFFSMISSIICNLDVFVHVEPCGVCFVESELLACSKLNMEEDVILQLGEVNHDSIASYKIAEKLGMTLMEGIYHDSTLGPVFFSRTERRWK